MSSSYESVNANLKILDNLRKEQEIVISKINKMHQKLSQASPESIERINDNVLLKLRSHYIKAKDLAEKEEHISNAIIVQLDALLPGQSLSHRKKLVSEQKRKRIKADVEPARLTSPSAMLRTPPEHANVLIGEQVAARVTPENADKDDWIVVKVIRFDREANKKYKLPPSCIIPFPKRTDASTAADFPTGSQVLAVYPKTTALYKAAVFASHRKRKNDDYLLEFDDDEEDGCDGLPKRSVPFYHVVQLPEGHRQ